MLPVPLPPYPSSTESYALAGEPATTPHPRRIRLRHWQRAALARLEETRTASFLAVATPGAGKTTFALVAAQRLLIARRARRLVIVVPTQHLKTQWANAAERLGLHLDPNWASGYGALPSDVHGVVVTYQQVAANPGALRVLVKDAIAILDEIHHAGESRAWGDGVRLAFEPAVLRLCLSGTPFRSDQNVIPFVRYDGELARADYEYGYGDALKDRFVVRPVYFPRTNGVMEWSAPDGTTYAATFDDRLTRDLANQRLRTAIDREGEWLRTVLAQAHAQLAHLRARDPRAGGLVITMDQEHANAVAAILQDELGVTATVATSDDPEASRKIARFADSSEPWIVAVRMVSEGVDIPRLRVGVFATNTITELFFRQAVGRLVRWVEGLARQAAYMFIPDDVRLRVFSSAISEQRQHALKPRMDDEQGPPREEAPPPAAPADEGEPEQLRPAARRAGPAARGPAPPARGRRRIRRRDPGLRGQPGRARGAARGSRDRRGGVGRAAARDRASAAAAGRARHAEPDRPTARAARAQQRDRARDRAGLGPHPRGRQRRAQQAHRLQEHRRG